MNKIALALTAAALSAALPAADNTAAAAAVTNVVNATDAATNAVLSAGDQTATVMSVLAEGLKVMAENGWGASDVADAIKSVRGLYVRDNATKEGRARWNGQIVSTTVDTNTLTRTTVYENGRTFTDACQVITPAASVKASNAKLKTTVNTSGVPAALAAARARRAAEIDNGPTNLTVTVEVGK